MVLNFVDGAKNRFHKLVERGYDPSVLQKYTHMQRIMNFNTKRSKLNDVRGENGDITTKLDPG